jgi:low temperature requirement protein LtrA
VILGVMFASLVMSVAIPDAFDDRSLVFVLGYLAIQIGRTAFSIWALRGHELQRNFIRILCWFSFSAIFWIAGSLVGGDWQLALWVAAIALETGAAFVGYWVPDLGATQASEWTISLEHFIERCQLFVIIALGESIIITGGTFSDDEISTSRSAAFVTAFVGSVAYWWIHFLRSTRMSREVEDATNAGSVGRWVSYATVPVIAGIIASAVGDELVIAHPSGHLETAWLWVIEGGPAVFLAGQVLLELTLTRRVSPTSIGGLVAILAVAPFLTGVSPLAAIITVTAILVAVAVADTLRTGRRRAEP